MALHFSTRGFFFGCRAVRNRPSPATASVRNPGASLKQNSWRAISRGLSAAASSEDTSPQISKDVMIKTEAPISQHRPPIAPIAPPNEGLDVNITKEALFLLGEENKVQTVVPWKTISSIAICVDGPNQKKYWDVNLSSGQRVRIPLSVPSQEKLNKRFEQLPDFHFNVAGKAFMEPLDVTKPTMWFFCYGDWNAYFKMKHAQEKRDLELASAELNKNRPKTADASPSVASVNGTSTAPNTTAEKGKKKVTKAKVSRVAKAAVEVEAVKQESQKQPPQQSPSPAATGSS